METDVDLDCFGSWTLKDPPKEAGAEPDECNVLGTLGTREVPDLAIAVEWSRKGLPKHEIYRRLGVRELWTLRKDGSLVVRVLTKGHWTKQTKSKLLPKLDVAWLSRDRAPERRGARAA